MAAGILAAGLVLSTMIGVWGMTQVKQADQTIVVTGSAKKRITSDKVIWKAGISFQAPRLQDAYVALRVNMPRVRSYLLSKGVKPGEIKLSAIESQTITARGPNGEDTGRLSGFSLKQSIEVRSNDVARVEKLSREATELINQGILLESYPPQYVYTKLADVKQSMLAEAAKDAKARAEKVAASVGSRIGGVRSARMGVLQITPADSNDVSDSGMNDTSSVDKDITSVVSVTFAVR
ncbi:MAG: SIMPL domain-containing protein [Akkermansiaceae bacterium]|nr:SIMPL domain-containing protein [Armatimonadota bacterium]